MIDMPPRREAVRVGRRDGEGCDLSQRSVCDGAAEMDPAVHISAPLAASAAGFEGRLGTPFRSGFEANALFGSQMEGGEDPG